MKVLMCVLAVVFCSVVSTVASASLLGDEITVTLDDPGNIQQVTGIAGTDDFTVIGPFGNDPFIPSFTDTTISVTYAPNGGFGSSTYTAPFDLIFSGLDWNGAGFLSDVLLDVETSPLIASDVVLFDPTTIVVDASGVPWWQPGDTFTLNLTPVHNVPEPTTLALMGLGLAGIGYRRHRSKKAA